MESKDEDEGTIDDPIVNKLIFWGTSADFERALDNWISKNCEAFSDATPAALKGEQLLEWGGTFDDYNKWLDLELEDFTEREGLSAEDVVSSMQRALEENAGKEFFPAFMALTDYDTFARQLHERAISAAREDAAAAAKESSPSLGVNISGVWEADPGSFDAGASERILKLRKCPWVFRKVLKRAAKLIKDIAITQDEHGIEWAYRLHLFGTTVNNVRFGEPTRIKNLWGKTETANFTRPKGDELRGRFTELPDVPEDTTATTRWWLENDGERLCWEIYCKRPDTGAEATYLQARLCAKGEFHGDVALLT